ncbi:MAG: hypothetical protein EOO23_02495 [Comamonadaceae bacterium]|nr:MAG: hypothetical protein EOO23_02495 [Comamonadaceae bacterium]
MRAIILAALMLAVTACASSPPAVRATATRVADPAALNEVAEGLAVRSKYGAAFPSGSTFIVVQSTSQHHTRIVRAVLASRRDDGVWTLSAVGEESSGLVQMTPTPTEGSSRTLTGSQGRSLDRLLTGNEVFRGPVVSRGDLYVGSPEHIMEIATPHGRTVIRWTGQLVGEPGEIADIVLGPA